MARTLSRQVGILTLGRVFAYIVVFCVPLVNVRTLSVSDLGLYRQYWLIYETIAGVLLMAIPNSLAYFFPRVDRPREKSVFLTQSMVFLLGMGLASWGIYGLLGSTLGSGLGAVIRQFFWPLCFFTLFMLVSWIMERLFIAERQVERQSLYQVVVSFAQAATVIVISWQTGRVDLIVWGLLAFALAKFVFTMGYGAKVYRPSLSEVTRSSFREQLSYTLPLGFASTVLLLLMKTDKFIITHYMGREMFAIYTIGALQIPLVDIIRSSITNVTFPLMARYQKDGEAAKILDLWQRATLKTAVMFFPLFIFLEVVAEPFIVVLFSEPYAGATPVFMIYLFMFLKSTIDAIDIVMIYRRNTFLLKLNVAGFILNVILGLALYRTVGWLGVPAALMFVFFLQNVAYLMMASRLLDVSVVRIVPWTQIAARFLTALVPGIGLFFACRGWKIDSFLELALAGGAYFTVYFGISLALGHINWAEIRAIFGKAKA